MIINNFNTNEKVMIVAEIGNNHEGNFKNAKKMIDLASKAGVDAVKFQTFKVEKFISENYDRKRFEKLKKFQLTYKEFKKLKKYTQKKKLLFISTPLDLDSADFLSKISNIIKIASSDNNFILLIKESLKKKKPLILSSGMASDKEIKKTLTYIKKNVGLNFLKKNFALMHCVTSYPVDTKFVNLLSIPYLRKKFKLSIGYSDHTLGNDACLAAVALGARIIEKHFTIDKKFSNFRDHSISADYYDLKKLVISIRKIEIMLGTNSKKIQTIERPFLLSSRRAIYASKNIKRNSLLSYENIDFLRPGPTTIDLDYEKIINKRSKVFINKGSLIDVKNIAKK